jgi:urease subunit beta
MSTEYLYPETAGFAPEHPVAVGGVVLATDPIDYNEDRESVRLTVRNLGDRPIQIGSHFHFFEVNRYLAFDRPAAFGCHLNIPATTAIRFEPGEEREVELVPFSGKQRVMGFNGLVDGYAGKENAPAYYPARAKALRRMKHEGFRTMDEAESKAEYKSKTSAKK